jgi:hypothetical protein
LLGRCHQPLCVIKNQNPERKPGHGSRNTFIPIGTRGICLWVHAVHAKLTTLEFRSPAARVRRWDIAAKSPIPDQGGQPHTYIPVSVGQLQYPSYPYHTLETVLGCSWFQVEKLESYIEKGKTSQSECKWQVPMVHNLDKEDEFPRVILDLTQYPSQGETNGTIPFDRSVSALRLAFVPERECGETK